MAIEDTQAQDARRKRLPGISREALISVLLVMPSMIWLTVFALVPLVLLVLMSFWTSTIFGLSTEFTLSNYRTLMQDSVYFAVFLRTLRIALTVTVISLFISYPVAYFIASKAPSRRSAWLMLLFVPFWSSYVVRTFVWLPMLGRTGFVNNVLISLGVISEPLDWLLYNEAATQIGLIYVYTLFMTLPIYLALDRVDRKLIEAASDLGAGPVRVFTRVILPLSKSGMMSGSIMVFLMSCGAYVTPQLLGGTTGIMIGNIIAAQYTSTNNWSLGAALSVTLIVVVLVVVGLFGRGARLNDAFIKG